MGLDQYWQAQSGEDNPVEIHRHRKVPALQHFMESAWREQGGKGVFNCEKLVITPEILDRLEHAITHDKLNKKASGFFWGTHCAKDIPDIQIAIGKARDGLVAGFKVFYDSWW